MAVDDDGFSDLDGNPDPFEVESDAGAQEKQPADEVEEFGDLASAYPEIEVDPLPGFELEDDAAKKQPAATEEAEEDPDDDSKLSENMKRRLLRERRVAESAKEAEVLETRQENERLRAENEQLKQRTTAAAQPGQDPPELAQARTALKDSRAKLRQAKVDGDVDAEIEAESEVRRAELQVWGMEAQMAQRRQAAAAQPGATAPASPPAAPPAPPEAMAWVDRNATWYNKPGFETATAKAREIDKELWAKGYRPSDPDYFAELDRRLKKAGVQKPGAAGTGSNVAPANAGAGGAPSPSRGAGGTRTMRLSASDLQSMRTFKLDPTNKAHVQQYLREMRSERSEAA